MFRFSIRDLLWLTLVVAMGLGWFVRERSQPPVVSVRYEGADASRPAPGVLEAIAGADAIVVCPSNPVISIGPILAVPGLRAALEAASAAIVAVSPFVGGEVLKGPTEPFCAMAGLPLGTGSIEKAYAGVLDGVVADELGELPGLQTDVLMNSPEARRRVAAETLDFARRLRR